MLDLLKRNGIDVPFACEEGSRGFCASRVGQGPVKMRVNEALDQEELETGYVIACQAITLGGDVRVHYDLRSHVGTLGAVFRLVSPTMGHRR